MSDTQSYLTTLRYHKDKIINQWYKGLDEHYPGFYDREALLQATHAYYEFLLDIDIPLETHPLHNIIPMQCEILLKKEMPLAHIMHSNQLWVDALLFFVQDPIGQTIPMSLIRTIIQRVFSYERIFLSHYHGLLKDQLMTNERTITDLHESRLTIAGKMAASMAHEIRNPLTAIQGFLKLIRNDLSKHTTAKLSSYLDIIESEFVNIQMQITGFLSFSKRNIVEEPAVTISSNTLIKSVVAMITPRIINDNIHFEFYDGNDIELKVQKIAVQQVLSNILNNSIDALAEIGEYKKLTITSEMTSDHTYVISITNNGPEIPEAIKDTLFEPFVTSKKEGTGLGLAICKQIMTKNDGDVTFASNASETTFYMIFHLRA
ncbi:sensor histidine kinase [Paenibacillus cremeus]|nr:HAMP domain-containing sensor histidine kinase [Paenibacillus cremeus]